MNKGLLIKTEKNSNPLSTLTQNHGSNNFLEGNLILSEFTSEHKQN